MEVRAGFETTELGVVPAGWEICPVGQKGEVVTGKALAVNGPGRPRPYLRTKNVFDGRIDIDDVLTMPMTDDQFAQFRVQEGDVLLNEGQSLELVGRCATYRGEYVEPCAIQNQLIRFRAKAGVSGDFASHLFRYCQQTGVFARIALQTTSIAHLGGSRFQRLLLAWPKTDTEQGVIAAALSDVDALVNGLGQFMAKKRNLKQAAMQQLLTGKTRLPGFTGEWEMKELKDFGVFLKGRGVAKGEVVTEGYPCIRYGEIYTHHHDIVRQVNSFVTPATAQQSQQLEKGDLLFAGSGETAEEIGKCVAYVWDVEAYAGGDIVIFRPRGQSSEYLAYLMNDRSIVDQKARMGQGDAVVHIGARSLASLRVHLPPEPEQRAIATVLMDMDAELAALEQRLSKTRALKQAMMQELLTGRTRLISPQEAHA
jgi:type I restriction enzyme S subunit